MMTPRAFIEVLRRPLAELPHELEMVPVPRAFDVSIRPPGSKSITNRVLLLAALAEGESEIRGALLDADDARVMIEALRTLGVGVEIEDAADSLDECRGSLGAGSDLDESRPSVSGLSSEPVVRIEGVGGRFKGHCTLNLKNAGTATRFLTAAACLADGPVVIDGNERMRQRPIGELVSMLREVGVKVEELGVPGCVPLRVWPGRPSGARLAVGVTSSSQFVSALMLIGCLLEGGLRVAFTGEPTSRSYIDMTATILRGSFGVRVDAHAREIVVANSPLRGGTLEVEPDASGATYFWGAQRLIAGSRCAIPIDARTSTQGDARFPEALDALERAGDAGAHIDLSLMPDAAMTLGAVACFARAATTITGLRTLRVKETDRLAAMRNELTKLGVKTDIFSTRSGASPEHGAAHADEGIELTPPARGVDCSPTAPRVVFDTYDDHRMAMSLALVGLRRPNVVIRDPACVAKTYPTYWRDLAMLYQSAIERSGA